MTRAVRRAGAEPAQGVEITVLICTRNRAAQLEQMLGSVLDLEVPKGLNWEVLVVDNGSTDSTAEVVDGFADRLPIRRVREEQAGLSIARNRGVREAKGRYICWTDDDVLLDRHWLKSYAEAFARHPEAAIFGGKIVPVLRAPTPGWFARNATRWPLNTLIADRNFGDRPIPLDFEEGVSPWGANFAVRTAEQRRALYEPGLGVSPNQRRLGEEAESIFRMMRAGATGWWVPGSVVLHQIPVQRQTLRYVFEYNVAYGETLRYAERSWPQGHHLSSNTRDLQRVAGPASKHLMLKWAHLVLFAVAWTIRFGAAGLYFLARAGLHAGAAQLAREPQARPAVEPATAGLTRT